MNRGRQLPAVTSVVTDEVVELVIEVRGIAAQSLFVGILAMAANFRKIAAHRALVADGLGPQVAARARRRRMSITDYRPPPTAS